MKPYKKIINEENKLKLIGILTIIILLWLVLYFIPEIFISLFNTLLGNLLLLIIVILVLIYDVSYGILLSIIFIIVYRFSTLIKSKEGFTWNEKSKQDFLLIQNTINPDNIFDLNTIQKTTSQEEVDYFNKYNRWPWKQKTKQLYIESINKNPFIRVIPEDALNYAMTIYNESAILRILSYQTKEGEFLLNGILIKNPLGNKYEDLPNGFGDYPYKAGLLKNKSDDIIKCNMNKSDGAILERINYTGKGGIFGEQMSKVSQVDYNDLENIIPGFKFLNAPCNPCGAINETPDYSCPFQLPLQNKNYSISNVWKYLWNI